jgi:hypothetical protein
MSFIYLDLHIAYGMSSFLLVSLNYLKLPRNRFLYYTDVRCLGLFYSKNYRRFVVGGSTREASRFIIKWANKRPSSNNSLSSRLLSFRQCLCSLALGHKNPILIVGAANSESQGKQHESSFEMITRRWTFTTSEQYH